MRQETLNTFNEGLNYDLNPLVTPNNVLTDNVNGTFITFNGNELSLQNDAGNTLINVMSVDRIFPYDPTARYYAPGPDHKTADKIAFTIAGEKMRCYICVADTEPGESPISETGAAKWREYVVRLSPGFYPLAMKEYGGVLYIISGRDVIRLATTYDLENHGAYALDDFVNTGLTTMPIRYYKSLKYNNTSALTDTTAWEYMGNGRELDKIRKNYNQIEFGSYPSPENYGEEGVGPWDTLIDYNQIGYPKILSDLVFRPGAAVSFTEEFLSHAPDWDRKLDINWITRFRPKAPPDGTGDTFNDPHERFYIAKLHQQLTSGYIDLTESINYWYEKWYDAGHTNSILWLFDPEFKYYCPFLYKGKLAFSLDIRDLVDFSVVINSVNFNDVSKTFTVILYVTIDFLYNPWTIWVNQNNLLITISNIIGTPDINILNTESTPSFPPTTTPDTTVHQRFKYTITISNISALNLGETMKYEITPIFDWEGALVGETDPLAIPNKYLPPEYIEEHTIIGSVILLSDVYTVRFSIAKAKLDFANYNLCELDNGNPTGYRIYNVLPLVNAVDEYINLNLEPSNIPYVFVNAANYSAYVGTLPLGAEIVGTYTINDSRATFSQWILQPEASYKSIMISALSNVLVRIKDDSCLGIPLDIIIDNTIYCTVQVFQNNNSIGSFVGTSGRVNVQPNVITVIKVVSSSQGQYDLPNPYEDLTTEIVITEWTTITLKLIAKLYAYKGFANSQYWVLWPQPNIFLGGPDIVIYLSNFGWITDNLGFIYPISGNTTVKINVLGDNNNPREIGVGDAQTQYRFAAWNEPEVSNYYNFKGANIHDYSMYNNIIFRMSGNLSVWPTSTP